MRRALAEAISQELRRVRLETDVPAVARPHVRVLQGFGGVRVEVPPAGIDVGVMPRLAPARLPIMRWDEADLRVGTHQPAQVIEQSGRDLRPAGDADPGPAQCRPGTAALCPA